MVKKGDKNKNHQRVFMNPATKNNSKRGYLQISFGWMFAIIAGIFILFLAIYATVKIINTENTIQDAKTGKDIGTLLNPLETGFETAATTFLTMPVETRIINKCDPTGIFGRQIIQISQRSLNKWTNTNIDISFPNKYLFSERAPEGKKFYLFTKPFEFPFKVSSLTYLTSSDDLYCFVNPPENIKDEIYGLGQANFFNSTGIENCPENSVKICFPGNPTNCDIEVNYFDGSGFVSKKGNILNFETDALMYAAIFAEKNIYDCQVERLMKRTGELASLYRDKANFIAPKGCNSNLNEDLNSLSSSVGNLTLMKIFSDDLEGDNNNNFNCKLW